MQSRLVRCQAPIAVFTATTIAVLAALLLSIPLQVSAGTPVCVNNACILTDTTVQDFASGDFYLAGLRNVGDGEVQLMPIGVPSAWVTDTYGLPGARSELAAVIYRDVIYAIGGFNSVGVPQATIYSATTSVSGAITPPGWVTTDNLLNPRASMAAVVSPTQSGGYLYVLGGSTTGGFTSTILYKALDSNGALSGSWLSASLPNTTPLVYEQAVVHAGYLYVLGGHDSFFNYGSVYHALINANGSLGAWTQETNDIPMVSGQSGRHSFAAVVWPSGVITDYIYLIAGQAGGLGSETTVSAVHYAPFNPDGSIGAWAATNSLNNAFNAHGAVQSGGQIYVTGGSEGIGTSQAITKVQSALIDATTGGLRDLGGGTYWVVSNPLAEPRLYHANVINSGGQIYVIGGYDQSGTAKTTTYRGSASGVGSLYAAAGNHTSRIINFGGSYQINTLNWNTSVAGGNVETITLQYRASGTPNGLLAQAWSTIGNAAAGSGITNTYSFTGVTGNYFQYRALLTTTAPYTHSPALNLLELRYSANGPDLQVSKSDGVSTSRIGQVLSYTIFYTNNDLRSAPGVVLTETPPISTTFIGGTAGWTATAGVYKLTLGTLSPSAGGSATFIVQVSGKPGSGVLNNVAQVGYDGSLGLDPTPVNNASIDSDSVEVVDLYVSADDFKSSVVVSSTNVYSISFGNSGQLAAANVIITDTIPPGLRYTGGPEWTSLGNGVFVHNAGTLAPAATGSAAFTTFISDTYAAQSLTNTVQIGYDGLQGPDGDPINNLFTDIDSVISNGPDLVIFKSDSRTAVFPGDVLTYSLLYNNLGSNTATNVVMTETLPANTAFVGPAGWNFVGGSTYTRAIGNVDPSQASVVQFVVRVNTNAPLGSLTNNASIGASNESSLVTGNNFASDVDVVSNQRIDLQVNVNDGVDTPKAGQLLTYTIVYANVGSSPANSAALTATLSAGLTYVGSGWTALGGGAFTRNVGNLTVGAGGATSLIAQVNPNVNAGAFLSNTVVIGFAGLDANPADNTSTDLDYISPPHLSLQKDDGVAVVQPNQILNYTFTYRNTGGSLANNIVITETPPASNVSIVDATGWTAAGGIYTRIVPSLAAGASATVTISMQVSSAAPNGTLITNSVRISADQATTGSDNVFTDVDIVSTNGGPDIRILGANVAPALAGQPTAVVITLTNAGPVSTNTWFFTDLYVDRMPTGRTDLGDSFTDVSSALRASRRATIAAPAVIGPGEVRVITINAFFAMPGTHQIYVQADTCDLASVGPSGNCFDPSYGRIAETNEANNILGPISVSVQQKIYLPVIRR